MDLFTNCSRHKCRLHCYNTFEMHLLVMWYLFSPKQNTYIFPALLIKQFTRNKCNTRSVARVRPNALTEQNFEAYPAQITYFVLISNMTSKLRVRTSRRMLITWSAFNVWLFEWLKAVGVCPTRRNLKSGTCRFVIWFWKAAVPLPICAWMI